MDGLNPLLGSHKVLTFALFCILSKFLFEKIQKFFGVNFKDFLVVNFKYSSENIESELMKTVTKNVIKFKITIRKVNFAKVVGKNDSMFGAMNPDL